MNNKEILDELKYLYLELKNKDETIKEGIKRFIKTEQEIRLLLNLVENKLRNDNSEDGRIYKTIRNEEINNMINDEEEYKTSYFQYFIHKQIYIIVINFFISLLLFLILKSNNVKLLAFIILIYMLFSSFILIIGFGYIKGRFMISNSSCYFRQFKSYNYDNNYGRKYIYNNSLVRDYTEYISYDFKKITNIIETTNNIIIFGDIVRENNEEYNVVNSTCDVKILDKFKLIKCFNDNSKLIEELRKRIEE